MIKKKKCLCVVSLSLLAFCDVFLASEPPTAKSELSGNSDGQS